MVRVNSDDFCGGKGSWVRRFIGSKSTTFGLSNISLLPLELPPLPSAPPPMGRYNASASDYL